MMSSSEVFLSTEMDVLIVDGSAMRPPIGSVTLRKFVTGPKPSAKPASRKRAGTASKPARKFSIMNAPPQIVIESQATVNGSRWMPSSGVA
jgi:hypothetical protein